MYLSGKSGIEKYQKTSVFVRICTSGTNVVLKLGSGGSMILGTMAITASSTVPRGDETILMVEPDPETRALAVFMLSRLGYRVLEARNAVEAVKLYSAQTERVDLLFTETLMSKVNGHELAQILTRETPQLRVLYLSDTGYERLTRKVA